MSGRVRLEGGEGFYGVFVDGVRVGVVVAQFDSWAATLLGFDRRPTQWAWTAPTRRDALAGLLRHLDIEEPAP